MLQLTHYNSKFNKRYFPITLVCENIKMVSNIGGLFRIADAFGIDEILFCGEHQMLGRHIRRSSRNTEKFVSYRTGIQIQTAIDQLRHTHKLVALEITNQSLPLHTFTMPLNTSIALVIGNENYGITDSVIKQCDHTIHIEMYGTNTSMNVVQATGIALYEITKQLK